MKIRKAVIPVAGLGTRFLPATKVIPKELLPIVDKPSIHYLVDEIVAAGIQEIILIIGRGKQSILDYFDRAPELEEVLKKQGKESAVESVLKLSSMAEFVTVWQSEPLGLGHAVLCAKEVVGDEPFLVCLPDDLIDSKVSSVQQMLNVYNRHPHPIIAIEKVPIEQSNQYGMVKAKEVEKKVYAIEALVEKPPAVESPSDLAVVGRYLLFPEVFQQLENIRVGKEKEIQLTDALHQLAVRQKVFGFEFSGTRFDTGSKLGFLKANITYGLKREHFNGILKDFIQSSLKGEIDHEPKK